MDAKGKEACKVNGRISMKICVSTFYNITHPGAILQAFSLCKVMEGMGHEVCLVNYPAAGKGEPKPPLNLHSLYAQFAKSRKKRECYRRFVEERCNETSRAYTTYEDLKAYPPEAEAYVCGSDQIWNPSLTGGRPDPAYFLNFGDPSIRRISYAASYGGVSLSEEHTTTVKSMLQRLDHLSAREKEGQELTRKLTGREVELVVDPTLLFDDWNSVARPTRKRDSYVLLYQLQKSSAVYTAARQVARRMGKPLLNIDASMKFWDRPGRCVRPFSPDEWLGLFQNASAVVTNSFHGTVFSALYERPFHSISLTGEKAVRAERMRGLCEQLGLANRFVETGGELSFEEIEWASTRERVQQLRERSLSYLSYALR